MKTPDLLLALLIVIVWGANFTVIRIGLDDTPPLLLAALRYVLAALPAVLFIRRPKLPPTLLLSYGLCVGFGQFGCLFYAMHLGLPAGISSVILQSQALFTFFFGAVLLGEKIAARQLAGLCLAMIGLYLVAGSPGMSGQLPPLALILSLVAAGCWGFSNIIVRKANSYCQARGKQLDILGLIVWSALVPPLPLLLLGFLVTPAGETLTALRQLDGHGLAAIAFLAYGATIFGYGGWSRLLSRYPANRVAPLSLLVPVAGIITARLVLGEHLTTLQWGGCILVLGGLAQASIAAPSRPLR